MKRAIITISENGRVKCFALQLPNDATRLFLQVGQHSTTLKWSLLLRFD